MAKRYVEPVLNNDVELVLSEDAETKTRLAFYAQNSETQAEFEKLAKRQDTTPVQLFAQHLFNQAVNKLNEEIAANQKKIYRDAAMVFVITGKAKTIDEALTMMGVALDNA